MDVLAQAPITDVWLSLIAQVPSAAAVIFVVVRFLQFLKDERIARSAELAMRHTEYYQQIASWLDADRKVIAENTRVVDANTKQFAVIAHILKQNS